MNSRLNKSIKWIVAVALVSFFFIQFTRQWTNIPRHHIIYITPEQDAMNTTKGLSDYFGWASTFIFFTTLSNVIAIVLIFVEWASFGKFVISKKVKLMALLYMFVTGIIFWTSIAPFMPWGYDWFFDWDNVHEHAVVLIAIIWFTFSDKRKATLKKEDYAQMLLFPIVYLALTASIYFATPENIAIYPFLEYKDWFSLGLPLGWSITITILFILMLLGIFIGAYWLMNKLSNKLIQSKA